jgi:hypothetical protein
LTCPAILADPTPARGSGRTRLFRGVFAIWPAAWPVHGYAAGAEHLSPRRWLQRLESPAAGLRGQARLPSVMNFGTHAQGAALQESIFAGAGRQSRAELAVLARDAQASPLMRIEGVTRLNTFALACIELTVSKIANSSLRS